MSTKRDEPITLAQVRELSPGDKDNPTWINGELTVGVTGVRNIKDTMWSATLFDPDNPNLKLPATFFGKRAFGYDGAVVTLSGSMQLTEYKGAPQLTAYAKCQVNKVGQAGRAAGGTADGRPPSGSTGPIPGITIGMAINNACNLIGRDLTTGEDNIGYMRSAAFSADVWTIASNILRVAARLEKGRLALSDDSAGDATTSNKAPPKQEPPPPPPPKQEPPPARGQTQFDEEDVPF